MTGSRAETRPTTPAAKALTAVWFAWALLFLSLGLLAAIRRLAGGYTSPPSLAALAGWSVFVAGSAASLRWMLWRKVALAWPSGCYYVAMGGLSAGLLLWIAALTIAGAPIPGLVILWALASAEEGIAWPLLARRRVGGSANTPIAAARPDSDHRGSSSSPADADRAEPSDSDAIVQQLTRTKPPEGPETIVGWLRLPLAPGQRSGVLHAAFCPPLEGPPTIEFEQVDGPPARIKLTQSYAYGARFDVKLTQPVEEADSVVVQFSAATTTASPGVESAAGGRGPR